MLRPLLYPTTHSSLLTQKRRSNRTQLTRKYQTTQYLLNQEQENTQKGKLSLGISDEDVEKWKQFKEAQDPKFKIAKKIKQRFNEKEQKIVYTCSMTRTKLYNRMNAAVTLMGFPVHFWGFYQGIDSWLLVWPFAFSVLWLMYSIKLTETHILEMKYLNLDTIEITTLNIFGQERKKVLELSKVSGMSAIENRSMFDKFKKFYYFDFIERRTQGRMKLTRYGLLKRGEVVSPDLFNYILSH
eukprot:TRINITY_DN3388_c0_g1_i1.p1 TRINITY_DN3388_c0_g1~~TRINITY_DN3388_c0_g1_i1.p1  ORF type:complete len:241 (+),score=54.50 TRINITY_DN3388_c0_g1_i1:173-895(+)